MILRSRSFVREEPAREAKLFLIFSEGKKREPKYFEYFSEISSQIRLKVIPAEDGKQNNPTGLYDTALKSVVKTEDNQNPEYEINDGDEVWFVIDTDTWGDQIDRLRENCINHNNWNVAQSNPCFEVWLYYHVGTEVPEFEGMEAASKWKSFVNQAVKGGFDSRKHSIYIKEAISSAKKNYREKDGRMEIASTEVFKLAESFFPLVQEVIEDARRRIP